MLADLALTPELAGKMLHVTPRTVRYWISGKTTIPYAAYRLLRILTGAELPCNGWDGWHMHSGKLWSPEGFGFLPKESSWWSLLVRQARSFGVMYDRHRQLDIAIQGMRDGEMEPRADGTGAMRSSAGTLAAAPQITLKTEIAPRSSNTGGKLSKTGGSSTAMLVKSDRYPRGIGVVDPDGDKGLSALLTMAASVRPESQEPRCAP